DTLEGQEGADTMLFNGANISEQINITAIGNRVRFTRDIGSITMDLNDVETIDFNALGGSDNITVNDLSGTDVTQVNLDLASPVGSGVGDGQPDSVTVTGTNKTDAIQIMGAGASYSVLGLPASVSVTGSEGANDQLFVNARNGNDTINASTLPAGVVQKLHVDAGLGSDRIFGSQGADELTGGDGNEFVDGNEGDDLVSLGAGNDVFQWDPGDGSDIVEGQDGADRMIFNGSNLSEIIDISTNGNRVRFVHDLGNIVMDLNGVETIDFNALD